MQYLGKLKRRMFLARLDTDNLPLPGDEMVTRGKTDIDGSGKVVDAEFDQDGVCHCLYIAQISKADADKLQLLNQPQCRIQNLDLPYSLDG
jgi:folate-binding Fe-S cluster repair protein YgfZ